MRNYLVESAFRPESQANRLPALTELVRQVSPELEAFFSRVGREQRGQRHGSTQGNDTLEFPSVYGSDAVGHTVVHRTTPRRESLVERERNLDRNLRERRPDIPLSPEAQQAKDNFVRQLEQRFANDPETLARLRQRLDRMDQNILHRQVSVEGSSEPMDRQRELAETYRNLSRLTDGSPERLTYRDRHGREQRVWSRGDVDNIIVDTVVRLENPDRMFNQGRHNTCACESIMRGNAALTPGTYSRMIADVCSRGEYESRDQYGRDMTVRVDRASLRLDSEARERYWDRANRRGAAGQIGDLAIGSFVATHMGRMSGDDNRFVYRQDMNPSRGSGTGEHFYDTRRRRDLGNHPFMTPAHCALATQNTYGHRLGEHYGRDTVIGGSTFRNVRNITVCNTNEELLAHARENERRGWTYSTVITHTSHYHGQARGQGGAGGRGGGLHATSLVLNESGDGFHFINNWGGIGDFNNVRSDQLLTWMSVPGHGPPAPDFRRQRFALPLPDGRGRLVAHDDRPFDPHGGHDRPRHRHFNSHEQGDNQRVTVGDIARQIYEVNAQLAHLTNFLASLSENDPRRQAVIAQNNDAQGELVRIMHQLRGRI